MAEEFPFSLLEEEVEETLQLFREFEVAADGDALGEKVQDKAAAWLIWCQERLVRQLGYRLEDVWLHCQGRQAQILKSLQSEREERDAAVMKRLAEIQAEREERVAAVMAKVEAFEANLTAWKLAKSELEARVAELTAEAAFAKAEAAEARTSAEARVAEAQAMVAAYQAEASKSAKKWQKDEGMKGIAVKEGAYGDSKAAIHADSGPAAQLEALSNTGPASAHGAGSALQHFINFIPDHQQEGKLAEPAMAPVLLKQEASGAVQVLSPSKTGAPTDCKPAAPTHGAAVAAAEASILQHPSLGANEQEQALAGLAVSSTLLRAANGQDLVGDAWAVGPSKPGKAIVATAGRKAAAVQKPQQGVVTRARAARKQQGAKENE